MWGCFIWCLMCEISNTRIFNIFTRVFTWISFWERTHRNIDMIPFCRPSPLPPRRLFLFHLFFAFFFIFQIFTSIWATGFSLWPSSMANWNCFGSEIQGYRFRGRSSPTEGGHSYYWLQFSTWQNCKYRIFFLWLLFGILEIWFFFFRPIRWWFLV